MNNAVLFDGQTVVPKRCHRSVCQAPSVANGCANDGSDAKGSAGADGCDLGQPVCESTRVGCVWLAVASITWQCLMSYFHAFIQTNSMIWDLNLECINEPKPTCLCCCLFGRDPTNWSRQIHLCNLPHIVWCRSVSTIFRDSLQRSSGQQTATARSLRSRWYLSPWVDGLENGALRSMRKWSKMISMITLFTLSLSLYVHLIHFLGICEWPSQAQGPKSSNFRSADRCIIPWWPIGP